MEEQSEVIAYKAFFKGLTNDFDDIQYEIGKPYTTKDRLQYLSGGYHMCEQFEDCFKFYLVTETEVDLAQVRGFGNMISFDAGEGKYDDSLGFMYICEKMEILKVLTRKEILELALELNELRLKQFLLFYPLTEEEIEVITDHCINKKYRKLKMYTLPPERTK